MNDTTTTKQRVALVIGVNVALASGKSALLYAEASAQQVANVLTQPACGFVLHGDAPMLGAAATNDAVRSAIIRLIRTLGPPDTLLIYFVGHGQWMPIEADRRDVYLVTANFNPLDVEHDENAHISMRWLQDKVLRQGGPGHLLLVLDCCHAGAVGEAQPDHYFAELRQRLEQYLNVQSAGDGGSGGDAQGAGRR